MEVFNRYASKYDEWYEKPFGSSVYSLELECLKKIYTPSENSLEIGVGSGRFAVGLNTKYGVDISKELLKMAIKRGVRGILAKAEELPFKDKVFDSILIVVSICFFDDPVGALKEARRVLKDTGHLTLGLILSESPWAEFYREKAKKGHPLYGFARFYSYRDVVSMLEKAGFGLQRIYTTLFEEPQDEREVKNKDIKEGFIKDGGFFCIGALPS